MEKIGLKKLLLQIKNIDLKRALCRFCKSDNPLKYVLFPLGALLLTRVALVMISSLDIDQGLARLIVMLSALIGFICILPELILFGVYNFFNLYDPDAFCPSCIMSVFHRYIVTILSFSILYLMWDLKRGKVDFSIKLFKAKFVSNTSNIKKSNLTLNLWIYFLWIANCFKQFIKTTLRKVTLVFCIPFLFAIIAGNDRYFLLIDILPKESHNYSNYGGDILKVIIEEEIRDIDKNEYITGRLKEKFGELRTYITKEEWDNLKILHMQAENVRDTKKQYIPERCMPHKYDDKILLEKISGMCKYNKNGVGNEEFYYYAYSDHLESDGLFYFSKNEDDIQELEDKDSRTSTEIIVSRKIDPYKQYIWHLGSYKCPKYKYYMSPLGFYRNICEESLTSRNVYFSDTIYLGIYDELKNVLNGKIFKIVEDISKHPCVYIKKNKLDEGFLSYKARDFECKLPFRERKFKYIMFYIYDKNGVVINAIKVTRED